MLRVGYYQTLFLYHHGESDSLFMFGTGSNTYGILSKGSFTSNSKEGEGWDEMTMDPKLEEADSIKHIVFGLNILFTSSRKVTSGFMLGRTEVQHVCMRILGINWVYT